MNLQPLDPRLREELKNALERGLASGELMLPAQVAEHTKVFRDRFGPEMLRDLDGEELLQLMHGRKDSSSRCLAYWLEFKNDDEFAGYRFGGIGGGSALKFGVYQRQTDGAWITGSNTQQQILSVPDAIKIARRQRDELLAGDKVLAEFGATDTSDDAYSRLQAEMEKAAPNLSQEPTPAAALGGNGYFGQFGRQRLFRPMANRHNWHSGPQFRVDRNALISARGEL